MSTQPALSKHRRRKHPAEFRNNQRVHCSECKRFKCSSIKILISHLQLVHKSKITISEKTFLTLDEFVLWKKDQEATTDCLFVQHCGKQRLSKGSKHYFYCNRTRQIPSKSTGKRKPKSEPSAETQWDCCAFMSATTIEDNGRVKVEYCLQHSCHDRHVTMSSKLKSSIIMKLVQNVDIQNIFDSIRNNITNIIEDNSQRIEIQCYLKDNERHANDVTSLKLLIEKCYCVLYFKHSFQDGEKHKVNISLAIQTKFQRQMLVKYGNQKIAMDSSQHNNARGWHLTTLMVFNEFGDGLPVAWLISDQVNIDVLVSFLEAIKSNVTALTTEHFLGDVAGVHFNAWKSVFNTPCHYWYSSWNVDMLWREKIIEFVKEPFVQAEIYNYLKTLQYETDETKFRKLFQYFLLWLDVKSKAFFKYFCSSFNQKDLIQKWASSSRMDKTNNISVENFHRTIGDIYFGNKQNDLRIDHLFCILLKITKDKFFEELSKCEMGNTRNYLAEIATCHANSLKITEVHVELDVSWSLISGDRKGLCRVRLVKESCDCNLLCDTCDICVHWYSCTCMDYLLDHHMCAHCHAVHMSRAISKEDSFTDRFVISIDSKHEVGNTNIHSVKCELTDVLGDPNVTAQSTDSVDILSAVKSQLQSTENRREIHVKKVIQALNVCDCQMIDKVGGESVSGVGRCIHGQHHTVGRGVNGTPGLQVRCNR